MNNDIKVILDEIKDYSEHEYLPPCCELTNEECKALLDYIAKLEQEKKELLEDNYSSEVKTMFSDLYNQIEYETKKKTKKKTLEEKFEEYFKNNGIEYDDSDKRLMNKTYLEWLEYYKDTPKEDIIKDLMLDIHLDKKGYNQLKQENEKLNHECDTYMKIATNKQKLLDFEIERNDIKQERIDKVIEYINKTQMPEGYKKELLSILKGEE